MQLARNRCPDAPLPKQTVRLGRERHMLDLVPQQEVLGNLLDALLDADGAVEVAHPAVCLQSIACGGA